MLADIAKRVGSTMNALSDQERRVPTLANRFAQSIQRMLHRSAVAGMGGDPYFGPGIEHLLARPYTDMEEPPHTSAEEIDGANVFAIHFRFQKSLESSDTISTLHSPV